MKIGEASKWSEKTETGKGKTWSKIWSSLYTNWQRGKTVNRKSADIKQTRWMHLSALDIGTSIFVPFAPIVLQHELYKYNGSLILYDGHPEKWRLTLTYLGVFSNKKAGFHSFVIQKKEGICFETRVQYVQLKTLVLILQNTLTCHFQERDEVQWACLPGRQK